MSAALRAEPDPPAGGSAAGAKRPRTTRLVCHATHPDPRRTGERCGAFCGHTMGVVDFVGVARVAPPEAEGTVWARCTRAACGLWNQYKPIGEATASPRED